MIVGVLTTCHLVLQIKPHVSSFYGVTSRIRFMSLLFPQVSQKWRYESEPPLKPSPLTCYKQFGTNWIIVLMFVEYIGCTYRAPVRYVTKTWSVVLLNKKHIYCYLKCIVYGKLLKPRQSFRITLYFNFYWECIWFWIKNKVTLYTIVIAWQWTTGTESQYCYCLMTSLIFSFSHS